MSVNKFIFSQSGNDSAQISSATGAAVTNFPIGQQYIMTLSLPTITALAGAVKVIGIAPFAGTVNNVRMAVDAAFTSTDIVATTRINTTAITTGAVTVATAGSAALSTASVTPSAANTFTAGQVLNATITGGVGTCGGTVQLLVTRTA